jgi:hypothetical protein
MMYDIREQRAELSRLLGVLHSPSDATVDLGNAVPNHFPGLSAEV